MLNKKINITVVMDTGKKIQLYFNDNKMNETTCSVKFDPYLTSNFIIGKVFKENAPTNRYFEGTMYNFMVYKKALTEEEIKQNYKVNKQRYDLE